MKDAIFQELEQIRKAGGGFLRPSDIVEFARDENSVLHSHFTWDNDEAAEKYRLAEARALIRVCVQVSEQTSEKVRAFISLSTDRNPNGGYRAFAEIVDDEVALQTLVRDAFNELASFRRKYEHLKEIAELNGVFDAIERAVPKQEQHEDRPAA